MKVTLAEIVRFDDIEAVTKLPVDSFESVLVSPETDSVSIVMFPIVKQWSVCLVREAESLKWSGNKRIVGRSLTPTDY